MQRLNAEAENTLRRIKEFTVREELQMGDDLGDSGTLPTTIADLLRRVLQKFETEESPQGFTGVLDFDPAYPEVFFLMVKWYWRPYELADQLLQLFQASCRLAQAEGMGVAPAITKRKWAIVRAVRYWQQKLPEDFKVNHELQQAIQTLQQVMRDSGETDDMVNSISLDSIGEERWLSYSITHASRAPLKFSLSFEATSARDFAEILCCLDYKLYRRIPFSEFCIYAHAAKPTDETPRIEECIRLFNGVTTWVVSSILREFTMVKRAAVIDKFVECTRHLFDLHAYNTLLAVVGGLNHFSIRRLAQTWAKVDKPRKEELEQKTEFFSSNSNFASYRQTVQALTGAFHIPVLGIVLKDLVAIDIQAKDMVNPAQALVNMNKYRNLWRVFSGIRTSQTMPPLLTPNLDRMRVLRAAIGQSHLTDEALEELSEAREPRQRAGRLVSGVPAQNALPKFSTWAEGEQTQLDSVTLSKHVKQMVDAVFKVYDTDQSGTISYQEFESISSNFPFIECFSVLDQDNDGTISYDEMLQYFLSANSLLRERFTHRFEEHTFLGTAVCEHCKGMMKGIVKQGVRCRDCGIACHKHCKDHVVVDCNKRKARKC
jgi:Ca2+-binding EF-hand superfamily protein